MSFSDIIGQKDVVKILKEELAVERINHAYLFIGKEGIGKKTLALQFARALLCNNKKNDSCDKCSSCRRIDHGNHPDLKLIEAAEDTKYLKIDQIREMQKEIAYKPYESEYKIYIIDGAERMTPQAANSLLKTLEEPPAYAVIILLAEEISKLLPTVISRCQNLRLSNISREKLRNYLLNEGIEEDKIELLTGLARGSIGRALNLNNDKDFLENRKSIFDFLKKIDNSDRVDIFDEADNFQRLYKDDFPLFNLLSSWYRDIIVYKKGNRDQLYNFDYETEIKLQAEKYNIEELLNIVKLIDRHAAYIEKNVFKDLSLQVLLLKIRAKRLQVRV